MYFQKFPKTFYSLDDGTTIKLITNILLRVVIDEELQNNFSAYDEYDVTDSDTPETLAYQLYGDSNLHWIILHFNNVLDPRFEWPLTTVNLPLFVAGKYNSVDGIHHYEDSNGAEVNANLILNAAAFTGIVAGNPIVNLTESGTAFVTSKPSSTSLIVTTTKGGFRTTDQIALGTNNQVRANITSTSAISGTAVTNFNYEDEQNETRRRIKVLKPQFIERVVKEFESKLAIIDG